MSDSIGNVENAGVSKAVIQAEAVVCKQGEAAVRESVIIKADDIRKNYGRRKVLNGISFYVKQGECVGIVGANGCGKSTLLSILAGTHKPSGGGLMYAGENPLKNKKLFSKLIGYVPQENPLMPQLTVMDNLKFWYCDSKRNLKQDLIDGTPAILGLRDYANVRVVRLSGGLKKRLSIACALANNPPVIIMDEPGASLDIVCKQDIKNYLKQYLAMGGTVIITSHEQEELSLCSRMYLLKNGTMQELAGNPDSDSLMEYIRGTK